jgi:sporulation protein YlmC with PRC-barrel domain
MRSSLSAAAALAMLVPATFAMAQQAAPADTSTPPAATTPADATAAPAAPAATVTPAAPAPVAPAATAAAPKTTTPAATDATPTAVFYTPTSDEWLASAYVGHEVYGPNNERLGKITDIVMDASGQAEAAIVGVGGFLGIGRKDVAVNFKSIKSQMKNNARYLTLAVTKPDLKNAPAYNRTTAKQM